MSLGTVTYEGPGLTLPIVAIELHKGTICFVLRIEPTEDATINLRGWMYVNGSDGSVVMPRVRLPDFHVEVKAFVGQTFNQRTSLVNPQPVGNWGRK